MAWTFEQIDREWLGGGRVADSAEVVVESFERVEAVLGASWLNQKRQSGARGITPTLGVVKMGKKLKALEGVAGDVTSLIAAVRSGDTSAVAELTAIWHVRSGPTPTQVELHPTIASGRRPDLRVRTQEGEAWTYIEVTQPNVSETQRRVDVILMSLSGIVRELTQSFGLEVFLRCHPSEEQIEIIAQEVRQISTLSGPLRRELPDNLGMLILSNEPGRVVLHTHPGEADVPRLCCSAVIKGPSEHRHIAVRIPYADERAEAFLRSEAKQLPDDAPGLIMVAMWEAPGGFRAWEPLVKRRFQPTINTRISAVCLFGGGSLLTPNGEAILPETKVLLNPHARWSLESWLADALYVAGAENRALSNAGPQQDERLNGHRELDS